MRGVGLWLEMAGGRGDERRQVSRPGVPVGVKVTVRSRMLRLRVLLRVQECHILIPLVLLGVTLLDLLPMSMMGYPLRILVLMLVLECRLLPTPGSVGVSGGVPVRRHSILMLLLMLLLMMRRRL